MVFQNHKSRSFRVRRGVPQGSVLGPILFYFFSNAVFHLLETLFPSLWSPPFPLHFPILIPLYLAKVQLSLTLTLSHLTIWWSGHIALSLFTLTKAAVTSLPTAHFVALMPLFPFQPAQYAQVFPLKPATFCKLSAGLGSTNKPATSFLLLSDSRSVLATLSSPPSFLLP